jgi:hypothetical protein
MAYIYGTAFEPIIDNNANDKLANIAGKFQASAADAICSAGFLCTRSALTTNTGFSTQSYKNLNTWVMVEAESTDLVNTPIYACNTYDVNVVVDPVTGNEYTVGANTLGLPLPAGREGTFTKIVFDGDHRYRFGTGDSAQSGSTGNLSTALSTNGFATIANGLLVPAATAPTADGTPYFKVIGTGTFTEGNRASTISYVDVEAHYAIATS